MPKFIMVLAAV